MRATCCRCSRTAVSPSLNSATRTPERFAINEGNDRHEIQTPLLRRRCSLAVPSALAPPQAQEAKIPTQTVDAALRAKLPKEIQDAGEMISVNSGSFPPYEIVSDTRSMSGASADLADALGELLGVKIKHESVSGLSGLLSGIKSGRYQFAIGPVGDFPERAGGQRLCRLGAGIRGLRGADGQSERHQVARRHLRPQASQCSRAARPSG